MTNTVIKSSHYHEYIDLKSTPLSSKRQILYKILYYIPKINLLSSSIRVTYLLESTNKKSVQDKKRNPIICSPTEITYQLSLFYLHLSLKERQQRKEERFKIHTKG